MQANDYGKGMDRIGIGNRVGICEHANHTTLWQIAKYDEAVFDNSVRPIRDRIGEALVMADYWKRRGNLKEMLRYRTLAENLIWESQQHAYDISRIEGNILLNEGIDELWDLGTGTGTPTAWNNTNARLGVGDSSASESASHTGLQASTNKLWKGMNGGYPTAASQKGTWQSDFGSSEANYAWNEFTLVNATDDTGKNLNRKVSAQGTKTSGQTWTLTLDITLS